MSDNPCPVCDRPIADTAYVCHLCARALAKRLLRAATLWEDLEDAISGLGHIGARQSPPDPGATLLGPWCDELNCPHISCWAVLRSVTRAQARWRDEPPLAHETPGPLRLGDIAAKDDAGNTVTTWARHIGECRNEDIPVGRMQAGEVGALVYLARHANWLMHRAEAEEARDELLHACDTIAVAVDCGAEQFYAGPCDVCGRDLYARPSAAVARCEPCDLEYPMQARREWLLQASEDRLVPASEMARAVTGLGSPVTAERIRQWAARGRLLAHGFEGTRPLYRVGDVLDLVGEDVRRVS